MKGVFLLAAASLTFAQTSTPVLTAEFDLNSTTKPNHFGTHPRSFFAATPDQLILVTIGARNVSLVAADVNGRIMHSRSDLAFVHAQIYAALPRPDGCVWLVSGGPYASSQEFTVLSDLGSASPASHSMGGHPSGARTNYTQLDLYSPSGEHLEAMRLLADVAGSENPIAAANEEMILRSGAARGSPSKTILHFGTVADGRFKERTQVILDPPAAGDIPLIAPNGGLFLIDKASGNRIAIDPKTQDGRVVRLAQPTLVKAAAADSESVYLLSGDHVLRTDFAGQLLSTLQFQFSGGFVPASIGVSGNSLFLVDKIGHTQRFQLN